jgi:hypothetical protein
MKTQTLKLINKWLREKIARQTGPDHSVKREEWDRVRFGDLDEGLVSRDRRAIHEKIETESKIRK